MRLTVEVEYDTKHSPTPNVLADTLRRQIRYWQNVSDTTKADMQFGEIRVEDIPEDVTRVEYAIDVDSTLSPVDAAREAYRIMTDPASMAPVLEVRNCRGFSTEIDLDKLSENG